MGPTNTQPIPLAKRFSPKQWWLIAGGSAIALIAILVTALLLISQSVGGDEAVVEPEVPVVVEPDPTLPEPEPDPTPDPIIPEPDPEPAPEPETSAVTVPEADLIGKTQSQVSEIISSLGLRLDAISGNVASAPDLVGTAYRVNPRGQVAPGTLIAVYFYSPIPDPPAPLQMAVSGADDDGYNPGDTVTLSWPAYAQCPSGFPVSGYRVEIVGGSLVAPATPNLGPDVTQVGVVLGDGDSLRASYVVTCQSLTSPRAPELSVTIAEPVPEEPAEPSEP